MVWYVKEFDECKNSEVELNRKFNFLLYLLVSNKAKHLQHTQKMLGVDKILVLQKRVYIFGYWVSCRS